MQGNFFSVINDYQIKFLNTGDVEAIYLAQDGSGDFMVDMVSGKSHRIPPTHVRRFLSAAMNKVPVSDHTLNLIAARVHEREVRKGRRTAELSPYSGYNPPSLESPNGSPPSHFRSKRARYEEPEREPDPEPEPEPDPESEPDPEPDVRAKPTRRPFEREDFIPLNSEK